MALLSSLLGSRVGRWVAIGLVVAGITGAVLWRAFARGRHAEQTAAALRSLDNIRTGIAAHDEIANMPRDERRRLLERWVRN